MAALLMGKALVAKNPKIQNNLWKQDVIKPFPSRFLKSSSLNVGLEPMLEQKIGTPSALSMFCNTSSTTMFAPFSSTIVRSFSEEKPLKRHVYVKVDNFSLDKLDWGEVENSPKGNGFITMTYDNLNLRIDTPSLRAPFGIRKYAASNGREESTLSLSFDNDDESSQKMLTIIKSIEQKLIETAIERASNWFAEWPDKTEAKIRSSFRSSLKPPRDPKFSPLWRLKLKPSTVARPTQFFYNGDRTPEEEVVPSSKVSSVVELRGVWVLPEAFGSSWSLISCNINEVGKPREKRFDEPNESQ